MDNYFCLDTECAIHIHVLTVPSVLCYTTYVVQWSKFRFLGNSALVTHLCSAYCAMYRQHGDNPPWLLCRLGLHWGM